MSSRSLCLLLCTSLFLLIACEEDSAIIDEEGRLQFQTINPWASTLLKSASSQFDNPALRGDTTETILTSLYFCIGDVFVSKSVVRAGEPDTLTWYPVTGATNYDYYLFEDYSFPEVYIPTGEYRSIKIRFKNIFYRHVELAEDPSVHYELLETMGSTFAPCDEADTSWASTDYFCENGNHSLNLDGVFELDRQGEVIAPFRVEADGQAVVSWRLGAGVTEPCTNYLIDLNGNLEWDCGVDDIQELCPPELEYMWDFVIEY